MSAKSGPARSDSVVRRAAPRRRKYARPGALAEAYGDEPMFPLPEMDYEGTAEWAREPCTGEGNGDHNCIRVRKWFRTRWVCVRCQREFKVDTR